jgi:hypothetical protein
MIFRPQYQATRTRIMELAARYLRTPYKGGPAATFSVNQSNCSYARQRVNRALPLTFTIIAKVAVAVGVC